MYYLLRLCVAVDGITRRLGGCRSNRCCAIAHRCGGDLCCAVVIDRCGRGGRYRARRGCRSLLRSAYEPRKCANGKRDELTTHGAHCSQYIAREIVDLQPCAPRRDYRGGRVGPAGQ